MSWLSFVVALCTASLASQHAGAQEVVRYGLTEATIAWAPPNEPFIESYAVFVSRNGGTEQFSEIVQQPRATLRGEFGDVVVARIVAIGRKTAGGPLLGSAPSAPSAAIRFLPAFGFKPSPSWRSNPYAVLHCGTCSTLRWHTLSEPTLTSTLDALPHPWRLIDMGLVEATTSAQVWQHDQGGYLLVMEPRAGTHQVLSATSWPDMSRYEALSLVELDGDGARELLVRDRSSNNLVISEHRAGGFVPIGALTVPSGWRLASAADFDGDGRSELWWQTGVPGQLEVWWVDSLSSRSLLLRVDTGESGDVATVADFDGDGRPEPLWRGANGELSITYVSTRETFPYGRLDRRVQLAAAPNDAENQVRGTSELDWLPGVEIVVQNPRTHRVSAILPSYAGSPLRIPIFDPREAYELMLVR